MKGTFTLQQINITKFEKHKQLNNCIKTNINIIKKYIADKKF